MHKTIVAAAFAIVLFTCGPAFAEGEWFAGAGVAAQHLHFEPYYTFVDGSAPRQFDNRANGAQVNLVAGQRFNADRRFFWGWQTVVGANGFEWSLSIPDEPAELRYSTPFTWTVSAVPQVNVAPRLAVYGSAGAGVGRVRQIKTSPSSSTYDIRKFEGVFAWGGGVRLRASTRTDMFVQYDQLKTATYGWDTFTPTGVKVEHVEDRVLARGVTFGALVRF